METLIYGHPINYFTAPAYRTAVKETPKTVLEYICKLFDITVEQIKSKRRFRKWVAARSMYFKYIVEELKYSLTKAGRILNRDHSTAIHAKNNSFVVNMVDEPFRQKAARLYSHFGRPFPK